MKRFTKTLQLFAARGGLAIMLALAIVMSVASVQVRADGEDTTTTTEDTTTTTEDTKTTTEDTKTTTGKTTIDKGDIDKLFDEPEKGKDIFGDVNSLASNSARSLVIVLRTVGIFIALGGLLFAGLKVGTGDPAKRAKAKEELGWKIAAAIIFAGGAAILGFAVKIAGALAGAL